MPSLRSSGLNITYLFQEDSENLELYRQGGYHPLSINDILHCSRYRIVHKLGFGAHSTVWLARDRMRDMYVAIKIEVAGLVKASTERLILEHLNRAKQQQQADLGNRLIPSLLDQFSLQGPNGQHQCFVSEPFRCSLAMSKYASTKQLFPLEAARAIVAQLILGTKFLHCNGVVHGGKT